MTKKILSLALVAMLAMSVITMVRPSSAQAARASKNTPVRVYASTRKK